MYANSIVIALAGFDICFNKAYLCVYTKLFIIWIIVCWICELFHLNGIFFSLSMKWRCIYKELKNIRLICKPNWNSCQKQCDIQPVSSDLYMIALRCEWFHFYLYLQQKKQYFRWTLEKPRNVSIFTFTWVNRLVGPWMLWEGIHGIALFEILQLSNFQFRDKSEIKAPNVFHCHL